MLVTRKRKSKSLNIELATRSKINISPTRVINLKVKQVNFKLRVSNSKWNFLFFDLELVARNMTFYFSTSS